jgi:hypothetical protein
MPSLRSGIGLASLGHAWLDSNKKEMRRSRTENGIFAYLSTLLCASMILVMDSSCEPVSAFRLGQLDVTIMLAEWRQCAFLCLFPAVVEGMANETRG